MTESNDKTDLLNVEQTAQVLGVSVSAVYYFVRKGKLKPVIKSYGRRRTFFRRGTIEKFRDEFVDFEQQTEQPEPAQSVGQALPQNS